MSKAFGQLMKKIENKKYGRKSSLDQSINYGWKNIAADKTLIVLENNKKSM